MSLAIRRAISADVPRMFAIKQALRLEDSDDGGFLLGTSADGYAQLVAIAETWVLVDGRFVAGFSIALPDPIVRRSDVWTRRTEIVWDGFDPNAVEHGVIGYFDQLAVLPAYRHRPMSVALAIRPVIALLDAGCTEIFATTVREPVENRAAWPLLARIGATRVGRIDEVYPEFGPLVSDLHHVAAATARERLAIARGSGSATARSLTSGGAS